MGHPEDAAALCRDRFALEELPDEGPVVARDQVLALARALKDELGFTYFCGCVAVHYPAADDEPDRTMVWYTVRRLPGDQFSFRVWVPTGESTPSLVAVWAGADWQEREQYDLVGTIFADHPDLRRIMMPEDWPGHPLRRDYAIDTRHAPWR